MKNCGTVFNHLINFSYLIQKNFFLIMMIKNFLCKRSHLMLWKQKLSGVTLQTEKICIKKSSAPLPLSLSHYNGIFYFFPSFVIFHQYFL